MKTIKMTPTWKQIIPLMLLCWENDELSVDSRTELRIEFDRLAEAADKWNEMQKAKVPYEQRSAREAMLSDGGES